MKKSILAVVVVAAVLGGVTLFLAGWFVGPTLFGTYGHGYGWRCWDGHGPGAGAAAMMGAPWTRSSPFWSTDTPRYGRYCGCRWHR